MDIKNVFILISSFLNLILGTLVYLKGRKNITNRTYSLVALSVFYWSVAMIFYRSVGNVTDSILWCRVLYTAPVFLACSLMVFVYVFPRQEKKFNPFIVFFISALSVFLIYESLFTDNIIESVNFIPEEEKQIIFGFYVYILYFIFVLTSFLFVCLHLLDKWRRLVGLEKTQVIYILLSSFFASSLACLTNLLLPTLNVFYFNWAGQIIVSIFVSGFIGYAIIAHRLMDIKFVMRQYLVLLSSFLAVVIPAAFAIKFYEEIIPQHKVLIDLAVLFLAVYFFPICQKYFYRFANKYLFSSLYDSAEVIAGLSDKLRSTLNPLRIYDFIYDSLNGAFHFKAFGVLNFDEKAKRYNLKYNRGFNAGGINSFDSNEILHGQYIVQSKPIVLDELKLEKNSKYNRKIKSTVDLLKKTSVSVLMPLNVKDKTIGLLALGVKESNDIYNDEDFKMLAVVSAQAAIAIENATLYEEARQFNAKLEEEVARQTKELRDANVKLKKLDESKSEFISIASHQLRTPLTVVKGYVSMILENNFGKINDGQRDSLDKVYKSNERLINLVENLLNLSRIESGRLQFKYETMNLETVVASVVEELSGKAKEKKLKLEYKHPAKPLPQVTIDQEKIRQVIMNLIDNSIKYTAKGSITVTVRQAESNIEFSVADSGMGILAEDLPHLFQKFQRGTGTYLVHTEGTGLGLYVAREMVEIHKGKVWAESKGQGQGSKFIVTIPINSSAVK